MYVPNYIPDPIEVPGNVTEAPYWGRLAFIRRVAILHLTSLGIVSLFATLPLPSLSFASSIGQVALLLLILSLVRIGTRATKYDLFISASLLPILLVSLALLARAVGANGYPLWGVAFGAACSVFYSLLCGRDFSFVGQYFLSLIVSSVLLAIIATGIGMPTSQASFLLGANALYLFYLVYDSASLLARRRLGEEAAAVVDLYRDVFNVFGYLVRVARHWRKHRIWAR